jgi:hypothetical protein
VILLLGLCCGRRRPLSDARFADKGGAGGDIIGQGGLEEVLGVEGGLATTVELGAERSELGSESRRSGGGGNDV